MLFFVYVLLLWCTTCAEAVLQLPPNVTIPALIVFGDSIGDQGANNNLTTAIKCDFPPYGEDFTGGFASGRFSNAKTPPDLLAKELGIKDLLPAYLDPNLQNTDLPTGVSFASGGTGYDPETSKSVSVFSFPDQLMMFKEYIEKLKAFVGEERASNILTNNIYLIIAGTDDIANTYFTFGIASAHYDIDSYTDLMVDYASNFVEEIYRLGARRIGVLGVPPVGCLPLQRTIAGGIIRGCAEDRNDAAKLFNVKLSSKIDSLRSSLPQSRVVYVDIYSPLLDIIQNPNKYGVEVVDRGCCGTGKVEVVVLCNKLKPTCPDRSKFLFWDSYHPTETGYTILVNQIAAKSIPKFF